MYRIVAKLDGIMWYVTTGRTSASYTMTRDEHDALQYVDMNDAIAVKFITSNIISEDVDLWLQHTYHGNDGPFWKTTTHMIPKDFLRELFEL